MAKIPTDTTVKSLLMEVMPELTKKSLEESNSTELAGTEISMVIETGSDTISYILKDGKEISVTDGDMDNAMLRLKVSAEDVERMIKNENLDMLLGLQSDLTLAKYNAIKSLKGSFMADIDDDGYIIKMEAILNGAASPYSTFKMTAVDSAALINKETNPVNLFMSGAMKIEGDMAFAMATQPLFS